MEAGRDGHRPRSVWRLLGHWARSWPGGVVGDGLTAVSAVYIHPDSAAVVLLTLGEAISSLETILNISTHINDYPHKPGNHLYRQTRQVYARTDHPLVVVGIDADAVSL